MENIKVLYHTKTNKDGAVIITLTEESYFKKKDCVDYYGDSDHYDEISDAIHSCGATDFNVSFDEECVSIYQLPCGVSIESIVENMGKKGFKLIKDRIFGRFCSEADTVYYCVSVHEDCDDDDDYEDYNDGDENHENKLIEITLTSKAYWNLMSCVDDGSSISAMICSAMHKCGASETCESVYELNDDVTVDQVLNGMRELGFIMIPNPDFASFLYNCN